MNFSLIQNISEQRNSCKPLLFVVGLTACSGKENFFHANYETTLAGVYGDAANPDNLVVEGGKVD